MSNMSYCRFQNTLSDLQDCYRALDGAANDLDPDSDDDEREASETSDLSPDERRARDELIALCAMVADHFGDDA